MQKNSLTSLLVRSLLYTDIEREDFSGLDAHQALRAYYAYFDALIEGEEPPTADLSPAADWYLEELENQIAEREALEIDSVVVGTKYPTLNHFYREAFAIILSEDIAYPGEPGDFFDLLLASEMAFMESYDRQWLLEETGIRITPNEVRPTPPEIEEFLNDETDEDYDRFFRTLMRLVKKFPDHPHITAQIILYGDDDQVASLAKSYLRPITDYPAGTLGFYNDEEFIKNTMAHCRVLLHHGSLPPVFAHTETLLRLGCEDPLLDRVAQGILDQNSAPPRKLLRKYPLTAQLLEEMKGARDQLADLDHQGFLDLLARTFGVDDKLSKNAIEHNLPVPRERKGATIRQINQSAHTDQLLRLKIGLRGAKPPIWRRLEISASTPLATLHDIIQRVFSWNNSHLHKFSNAFRENFVSPESKDFMGNWFESYDDITLGDMFAKSGKHFSYLYDFGDGWEHRIELEKEIPTNPDVKYPRCTGGRCAPPPDDIGGIWGYYAYLEAYRDPTHEDHEEAQYWFGEDFDPRAFSLEAINDLLQPFQ